MKKLFLTMMALVAVLAVKAQKTLVVAQDGTGDYSTIQAAVDAVSEGEEATIWVKAGTYTELVKIGTRQKQSTKKISLIGEGMTQTVITESRLLCPGFMYSEYGRFCCWSGIGSLRQR